MVHLEDRTGDLLLPSRSELLGKRGVRGVNHCYVDTQSPWMQYTICKTSILSVEHLGVDGYWGKGGNISANDWFVVDTGSDISLSP